jgi:hypothetical protein
MQQTLRIALKVLASILLGLFSLPTLGFGSYLLFCWFRIHTSEFYYADYPYAVAGLTWFALGLLSLWATLHGVWRRSFYGFLPALSLFLGLTAMTMIPNILPRGNSTMADSNYLSDVNSFFGVWYENNHRFPASEAEFRDALEKGPAAWKGGVGPAPISRYRQRGSPLTYEIVVVTDADGPRMVDTSNRPGVVYYCVSKDLQEFWVTMTGLQSDVAPTAFIARVAGLPDQAIRLVHAAGRDYPPKHP